VRVLVSSLCLALGLVLAQAGGAAAQTAPTRLTQLHDALHLSADQEAAWQAYAAAVQPDPMTQARHRAAERLIPSLTTPRRIALVDATMSQDISDFRRQSQAVIGFYGRLTPDQQKTFDRETVPAAPPQSGD
jgi:hypothetical protein